VILRLLNLVVIAALIIAAAYVYRIKYDSTVQAERLAKIRSEVRRERDTIAALRAEWGQLENPARIETLAKRYLHLIPIAPTQFDKLNALPDRPPQLVRPDSADPIGDVIDNLEEPQPEVTGSVRRHPRRRLLRSAGPRRRRHAPQPGRPWIPRAKPMPPSAQQNPDGLTDDHDDPGRYAAAG
jgi:hypothetical protein